MSVTMEEALKQSVAINDLFRRLVSAESGPRQAGDQIACQLVSDFIFETEQTAPGQMVFTSRRNTISTGHASLFFYSLSV